jgi:hypothetical protein
MRTKRQVEGGKMRAEYDFDYSTAVRGKYYRRLIQEGANVVVLEPDVAKWARSGFVSAKKPTALRNVPWLPAVPSAVEGAERY